MTVPATKTKGSFADIMSNVRKLSNTEGREQAFQDHLREYWHLFDADYAARVGVKRFGLESSRAFELYKEVEQTIKDTES